MAPGSLAISTLRLIVQRFRTCAWLVPSSRRRRVVGGLVDRRPGPDELNRTDRQAGLMS